MCLAPEGQGKSILYTCMLVPWGWAKRAAIFFKEIKPMETKPRWKFVLVEMKPIYLRLRDKPYFGGNGAENPCLSVSKKKLSRYWWKFCKCWKIRKKLCFSFCQTRTQEQSFPVLQWIAKIKNPPSMQAQLSLIVVNNCFYPSQVTQKKIPAKKYATGIF